MFIFEGPDQLALRADPTAAGAEYWQSYRAFAAAATEAGVLRGGASLHYDPATSATLTAAGTADGAFAASALALGGYFQIDVADRAAALDWAARLPAAATGAVEVRPGELAPPDLSRPVAGGAADDRGLRAAAARIRRARSARAGGLTRAAAGPGAAKARYFRDLHVARDRAGSRGFAVDNVARCA